MVTRLPLPAAGSAALVDTVVAERANGPNAAFFNGLRAEWRQRVEYYVDERGNPEVVPEWPEIGPFSTRFLTLYNKPMDGSSQAPILAELRGRKMQFCPSCGEEGTPNTLDHYLPKDIFPHFAITPVNLTPMCDICQQEKGVETVDDNGNRIYLHPYFDEFTTAQVIELVIGRPFACPESFLLRPSGNLSHDLASLVQRHIDGLGMARRYGAFFRDEYMRLLRLAKDARDTGVDIREHIGLFKRLHRSKTINLWPHIFYAAVEADDGLMDYIHGGRLPDNI